MIVPYSGNDDSYSSLSALAETLPLLYANTMQYRGRLFYEDSPFHNALIYCFRTICYYQIRLFCSTKALLPCIVSVTVQL